MALFKISKGRAADLPAKSSSWGNGFAWFTQDDGKFYIDYYNGDDSSGTLNDDLKIRQPLNADKADRADNFNVAGTLNVTGNTSLHSQSAIDNATIGTLAVTGAANFVQSPTGPTPSAGDSSTKLATTAFITSALSGNISGNAATADKVNHSITIGSYVFDGSDNINIPIYNGEIVA